MRAGRLLSLAHLTVLDAAPPDVVGAAAAAGFDAVSLRVRAAGSERVYPMLGDTPMLRETLARVRDTGVQVLDIEVLRLRPDDDPDDALRVLDAAARLGARFALVIGHDPDEARLTARFAEVCEAGAERGVRPALEFMLFTAVRTLADAVRVVERAGHPAGAVLVDALHLQRTGGSPGDLRGIAPSRLPYAQLCDGPAEPVWPDEESARVEARTARALPGDGAFPLRALVEALPPGVPLAVESPFAGAGAALPVETRARLAHAALVRVLESAPSA